MTTHVRMCDGRNNKSLITCIIKVGKTKVNHMPVMLLKSTFDIGHCLEANGLDFDATRLKDGFYQFYGCIHRMIVIELQKL